MLYTSRHLSKLSTKQINDWNLAILLLDIWGGGGGGRGSVLLLASWEEGKVVLLLVWGGGVGGGWNTFITSE